MRNSLKFRHKENSRKDLDLDLDLEIDIKWLASNPDSKKSGLLRFCEKVLVQKIQNLVLKVRLVFQS